MNLPHKISEKSFKVNPYTHWIYDHPARILPDPSPELLSALRGRPEIPQPPLHVELGSGSGNFLVQAALQHPAHHFLGFELRYKRLVRSAQKLDSSDSPHVWLLKERGERFSRYCPPSSVDHLYLHFPDPWPRPSQWKKRMVSPGLLADIQKTLKTGGLFHLKTDHSGYFLHSLKLAGRQPGLRIREYSNDFHRTGVHSDSPKTEFEGLFLSQGKPVYYLQLEKI